MRVLVTGGGGYLGCWASAALLDRGHAVRILDRFCFGEEALAGFGGSGQCEVLRGDIRRLQEHPALFEDVDAVLHLAALSNDPSCDLNPDMTWDVNVESTIELARQAMARRVRRFVFASACAVYGRGVFEWLDEESPLNPVASYGESKAAAERALLRLGGAHFEPVIARSATLFGWSPRMRFDLAINQMTASALRHGRVVVRGGGNQSRPFVHVRDAAEAYCGLIEAPAEAVAGEVFNVGSDEGNTRIVDLAEQVAAAIPGTAVDVVEDDEDLRSFRVRFGKIRERLGFAPAHTIAAGIAEVRERLEASGADPNAEQYYNVHRMKRLLATPVDQGGEPIAARFIPLAKPNLGEAEEHAVVEALRSGWLTSGPHIAAFEDAFKQLSGAEHAVAASSCTAALHLCMAALEIGPEDEVALSPITWASVGNLVLNQGARLVFTDVDPETLNMDPASLERVMTERTRLVIPVHMAGQACDIEAIRAAAARRGAAVIEDAAHAAGALHAGRPVGSGPTPACFSFYATKNLTTIEGGIITLPDAEFAARLRLLAGNGMAANAWERYTRSAVSGPAEVVAPGFKYSLNNVNAAIGLEQIKQLPGFLSARRRLAALYRAALADVEEIILPRVADEEAHAWHLFIVRLDTRRARMTRDELCHALRRENVGTGIHFYGLHLHAYYRERFGFKPEDFPNATQVSREVFSLPLHPKMSELDVHDVAAALKKVLSHARG